MQEKKIICIDDTKFIFWTNFSGDPNRDNFGSNARKGSIIIPDHTQARELIDAGFNVKMTENKNGVDDFVPQYYVQISANYDSKWPPKIYLVSDNGIPRLLDEDTVGEIDTCRVKNVNVVLNPYYNPKLHRKSLYIRTMYVEQDNDNDPYASRYSWGANDGDADYSEEDPF